ncbi:metal-dependent hydrolase [Dissulfurispira thermophila]|uniref:Metal-dependent hydrolase n=1 Tax=Dissulfurispira thermophila TaxID=2715679 RepID=A0A7G1H2D6_9BACT|nr:cyclase family protein [Dissulfurispira thermophila]BCB96313.1 metal-dependent hydrolase [Dissulfurispira thermophila]
MYIYLSYILTNELPVYGGMTSLNIDAVKSISYGDLANVYSFTMQNHWGTHVDCPAHFFENGKNVTDYSPEFWFFKNPQVVEISLKPSELLYCNTWIKQIDCSTDILILRSGWYKLRDNKQYYKENPGIHPEVGYFLRKNYPQIRAIGIDWISISPFQNRDIGREAHRAFLNPNGMNKPILLIEDMNLSSNLMGIKEVWVMPLRVETIDSAPCTVIGVIKD